MAAKMNERKSFLLSGSSPSMVSPTKNSLEGLVYHTHTHTHTSPINVLETSLSQLRM